jgi:tripartite-type tricarboxylate transporter receptor subunit TctC
MKKLFFIILMFTSQIAFAQLNVIVPYAAGGAYDNMSRKFARFVETKMHEQVTIENIGGAGGLIGLRKILNTPNSIAITNNNIDFLAEEKKLVLSDYQQITLIAENPYFLAVAATSGLTCESLRNRDKNYFIGSSGTGSGSSFPAVIVIEKYSNFTEVPYKGVSHALNDLLGKSIHIVFVTGETQQRPDLTMLANTTSQSFRGVPSWSKCLGIDKKYTGQFLMVTRSGADAAFISKMKKLVDEFVKDPETIEYFKSNGFVRP